MLAVLLYIHSAVGLRRPTTPRLQSGEMERDILDPQVPYFGLGTTLLPPTDQVWLTSRAKDAGPGVLTPIREPR